MTSNQSQMTKSTSNCPYEKCNGSGAYMNDEGFGVLCKCNEEKILEKKLEFANIPKEFKDLKVKDFDLEIYSDKEKEVAYTARNAVVKYIQNYKLFKEKGKGLYLYSRAVGSGKTRLAVSLGNALISTYKERVKFITTLDLLDEIKATYNKESAMSENELIKAIREVDVLILDDIGVEGDTSWVKEKFYSVLNGRLSSKKVTIFTSNSRVEELKQDRRTISRIGDMASPVKMPEQSIRADISEKENEELQNILFG